MSSCYFSVSCKESGGHYDPNPDRNKWYQSRPILGRAFAPPMKYSPEDELVAEDIEKSIFLSSEEKWKAIYHPVEGSDKSVSAYTAKVSASANQTPKPSFKTDKCNSNEGFNLRGDLLAILHKMKEDMQNMFQERRQKNMEIREIMNKMLQEIKLLKEELREENKEDDDDQHELIEAAHRGKKLVKEIMFSKNEETAHKMLDEMPKPKEKNDIIESKINLANKRGEAMTRVVHPTMEVMAKKKHLTKQRSGAVIGIGVEILRSYDPNVFCNNLLEGISGIRGIEASAGEILLFSVDGCVTPTLPKRNEKPPPEPPPCCTTHCH